LITDALVLIIFAINIFFLEYSVRREKERIDVSYYQLNDFGVKIGNIPKSLRVHSTHEVKLIITEHVRIVIEEAKRSED
jgi:hypothetical protein